MSQEQVLDQLYESLFTLEQMLTESIAQCAEVFEIAEHAGLSHVTEALKRSIIPQLNTFLDSDTEYSMSAIVESVERGPQEHLTERAQPQPQYSNSGNPKYDDMFNRLLESSAEIEQTGRVTFKLDEVSTPTEDEIEHVRHPLAEAGIGQPPRPPGQKEKVEFDGMENWRSVLNESSNISAPSRGGGAEDAINDIMNFSEAMPSHPPQGSPEIGNTSADVDASVANILSNL